MNHRGEAILRVAPDVLPDVEDRSARGVDQRAAAALEVGQVGDRHAESREDDHVARPERVAIFTGVGEDVDALGAQPVVDVRVVNDFAGQEDAPVGKPLARLIGVVDRAIDAVAEAELLREVDREAAGAPDEPGGADLVDDGAVVCRRQLAGDGLLHVEALAENQ